MPQIDEDYDAFLGGVEAVANSLKAPPSDRSQYSAGINQLRQPTKSKAVPGAVRHFLSKIEENVPDQPKRGFAASRNQNGLKVFMSYCWEMRRETVHEMATHLMQQKDFVISINMEPTPYKYAEEIKQADVVLVFISNAYAKNAGCRREIEYAAKLKREILTVRIDRGYQADNWFRSLVPKSKMKFDVFQGDNCYCVAAQICQHLRTNVLQEDLALPKENSAPQLTAINFKAAGVPSFSKSKYFSRPEDEIRVLKQIKKSAESRIEDGCLVISGDGGVGKTTLMASLISDEKNHLFFERDCNFHRIIWVNCFDWRETFDAKAFADKIVSLAKEVEDDADSATFTSLPGVAAYYKRKNLRLVYVLDDLFNFRVLKCLLAKENEVFACFVITRDAQAVLEADLTTPKKVERIEELTDDGIREMMKSSFKNDNEFLSEDQINQLAILCCGLPLIGSLISARINNCTSRQEAKNEYKLLTAPHFRVRNLQTAGGHRPFKTISSLFSFSLDQLDKSLRMPYYAFLLYNPAEVVSALDLGVLWGINLNEPYALRMVCRAFEKRSLIRCVKPDTPADSPEDYLEDRYFVHQMLYESAISKTKTDLGLSASLDDEECLHEIRVKIISGKTSSLEGSDAPLLRVLLGAMDVHRRRLFERILNELEPRELVEFCLAKSNEKTKGMAFLHYLYHFDWEEQLSEKMLARAKTIYGIASKISYRLIGKIFSKLKAENRDLLWRVISEKQSGTENPSCLLVDLLDDTRPGAVKVVDRTMLASLLLPWHNDYNEMKWEQVMLSDKNMDPLVQNTFNNDLHEVTRILKSKTSYDYGKALLTAARKGYLDIAREITKRFPDSVKALDAERCLPITLAAKNGHLEIVRHLYEMKPETAMSVDINGSSVVVYAAKHGQLECVKFLFENAPESLKMYDPEGHTPLMAAAIDGKLGVIEFLCENCPYMIDVRDNKLKGTASAFAAVNGQLEVVEFLHRQLFRDVDLVKVLTMAAANGQMQIVQFMLRKCERVAKMVDPDLKATPIMLAAGNGHLDIVEALYGLSGTSVEIAEGKQLTALMMAATGGHLDVVQFLYFKYPQEAKIAGPSALNVAIRLGHRDVAHFLADSLSSN